MTSAHDPELASASAQQAPPLDPGRPAVDGRNASPDQLRAQLAQLRTDLGNTVEELTHRLDVPARARARKDEIITRVRDRAEQLRTLTRKGAPAAQETVRRQPVLVGLAAAALLLLLLRRARRRRRRANVATD